jgi:hypothetical protein
MSFQCSHGNFPFIYLATFGLYLRMEYTYISLYGIPEHVVSKFIVLGYNSTYFSNKIQKSKTCYSEEQVISMLEFLTDNIFVSFQLRDVNTICRRSWYIAAHVWKIYDFKIEVVPFIINFSTELTTVVKFEV